MKIINVEKEKIAIKIDNEKHTILAIKYFIKLGNKNISNLRGLAPKNCYYFCNNRNIICCSMTHPLNYLVINSNNLFK